MNACPDDESEFVSDLKSHEGARFRSLRVKLLVGFLLILMLIFLGVLSILEFSKSTKSLESVKTKRFVKMDDYYEDLENIQQDIHLIPEGQSEKTNRRTMHHPNHRYLEMEPQGNIYKKIMKDLYDESGWSPKPFDVKTEGYLGSVQSIISKEKSKGANEYLKGLGGSMRLKGVYGYISQGSEQKLSNNPNMGKFYYSKEINNLMQNYSGVGDEKSPVKKAYKSHGAPFQVPVKDVRGRERLNIYRKSHSKSKQSWFKERHNKKPLTLLLDIYPMTGTGDDLKKERHNFSHLVKPPRNEFFKPGDVHPTRKFLFPHEGRNGIIMKLNLYPKEGKFSMRRNSKGEEVEEMNSNEEKRAQEKSFGWFSKKKEKKHEPKECSLMALKPDGKHVTAKWKNENGEWIHAKHLTVKYSKKKE